jgi:hypothetical protein
MGNCLVTKLKGTVDNPNLEKLGVWEFEVQALESPTNASQWFNFIDSNEGTITAEIIGDGHFIWQWSYAEDGYDAGKIIEMQHPTGIVGKTGSGNVYLSNGNYKVRISNKYNINILTSAECIKAIELDKLAYSHITQFNERGGVVNGNIDVLKDVPSLNLRIRGNMYGTLEKLMNTGRTSLIAFSSGADRRIDITGDIHSVVNSPNVQVLDVGYNSGIYGDISYLGYCTALTDAYVFVGTSVSGSIESMIARFRLQGKTTGTLNTQTYGNKQVTFNGQPLPDERHTEALSWTANTITCNGVTINA